MAIDIEGNIIKPTRMRYSLEDTHNLNNIAMQTLSMNTAERRTFNKSSTVLYDLKTRGYDPTATTNKINRLREKMEKDPEYYWESQEELDMTGEDFDASNHDQKPIIKTIIEPKKKDKTIIESKNKDKKKKKKDKK